MRGGKILEEAMRSSSAWRTSRIENSKIGMIGACLCLAYRIVVEFILSTAEGFILSLLKE